MIARSASSANPINCRQTSASLLVPRFLTQVQRLGDGSAIDLTDVKRLLPIIDRFANRASWDRSGSNCGLQPEAISALGRFAKRILDLVLASIAILLLWPLMVVIAVAVRVESQGPAIYPSLRVGKKGILFACYKFRTMIPGANRLRKKLLHLNQRRGPFFKMADDPRVTRLGRFLRKCSLDELPQLWKGVPPGCRNCTMSTVLVVFFLVFTVILIATLKQKPVYRAQVLVEIQKENPDIPTIKDLYELESVSDSYLKSQYSILASESVARQVINQLRLEALPEFNSPKWWQFRRKVVTPLKQTFAGDPGGAARDREVYQRVLERFQDRLTVDPVSLSRLVTVRFDSNDAELSARIVNTLAEDYIDQHLEARWNATQKATDWISQQLIRVKVKMEKSEEQLQDYAQRNGLVFLETDKGASENVANERLRQLQEELTKAQGERYEKEAVYRLVQSGDYGSLPSAVDNKLIQDLGERLAELKRELADLSTKFNPEYPRVKEIQSQIDEIGAALKEERQRAADKVTNEYLAELRREGLVKQALEDQQKLVNVIAEKAVQYNILRREVDTNKQLYEGLLQTLKQTGVSASLKASNIRIVDSAVPPVKPTKPRIPLNLAVATLLGLGLGFTAAFLQERLDDTLKGTDDVERLFGLPALALIPSVPPWNGDRPSVRKLLDSAIAPRSGKNATANNPGAHWHRIDQGGKPQAALVEAFRTLRASVLLSTADHPPGSLLITSTQPGEGKTTVATNLALSLAQLGQRVLLVDADLRFPSLQRLFNIRESLGLVSHLTGQQDWRAAVCPSGSPGLDLLLSGPVPPNPAELLSSRGMGAFIGSAKSEYAFVVIDSSPLLTLADSRILASLVDGVLMVVKSGATPREQVQQSQSSMRTAGATLIGVVLNKVTLHTNGYYGLGMYGSNGNSHPEIISEAADSWSTLLK